MIRSYIFFSIAFIFAFAPSFAEEWKTYTNEEFKFSIDFPSEPEKNSNDVLIHKEKMKLYSWKTEYKDSIHPNSSYKIFFTELPNKIIHSDSSNVEQFLRATQISFLNNPNVELLTSFSTENNGYQGIIYYFKLLHTKQCLIKKILIVENRLFQFYIFTNLENQFNTDTEIFLNSFKLFGVPDGNFKLLSAQKNTYKINFPGKATKQIENLNINGTVLPYYLSVYEDSNSKNISYMASQMNFPDNYDFGKDKKELEANYKKAIAGSVKNLNGKLISTKDIIFNGIKGKEARISILEGRNLTVFRYHLIKNIIYMYGVITTPQHGNNDNMIEFFNSFEIMEE